MTVKQYIEPELERRVVIMTSLDVKWVFGAAWWPAILKRLREADWPRNLYQLTQNYFRIEEQCCFLTAEKWRKI
jgi:hypothetical protein